tara:strand:+ start:154 stop:396 length:243 start_codon:yes stop_codon:yes gene_type:complete
MQKPTITQIKQSGVLGEYFFNRDTLRFFGQTMASFKTDWHDKDSGIVRLYAPMFMGGDNVGTTERFLQVESNAITTEVRL